MIYCIFAVFVIFRDSILAIDRICRIEVFCRGDLGFSSQLNEYMFWKKTLDTFCIPEMNKPVIRSLKITKTSKYTKIMLYYIHIDFVILSGKS